MHSSIDRLYDTEDAYHLGTAATALRAAREGRSDDLVVVDGLGRPHLIPDGHEVAWIEDERVLFRPALEPRAERPRPRVPRRARRRKRWKAARKHR